MPERKRGSLPRSPQKPVRDAFLSACPSIQQYTLAEHPTRPCYCSEKVSALNSGTNMCYARVDWSKPMSISKTEAQSWCKVFQV